MSTTSIEKGVLSISVLFIDDHRYTKQRKKERNMQWKIVECDIEKLLNVQSINRR